MSFRRGRFLSHSKDAIIIVEGNYPALQELLLVLFIKAHNAGGMFLKCIMDEALQAEIQQIIACNDKHIVIKSEFFDGELNVANGSESCLIA